MSTTLKVFYFEEADCDPPMGRCVVAQSQPAAVRFLARMVGSHEITHREHLPSRIANIKDLDTLPEGSVVSFPLSPISQEKM